MAENIKTRITVPGFSGTLAFSRGGSTQFFFYHFFKALVRSEETRELSMVVPIFLVYYKKVLSPEAGG